MVKLALPVLRHDVKVVLPPVCFVGILPLAIPCAAGCRGMTGAILCSTSTVMTWHSIRISPLSLSANRMSIPPPALRYRGHPLVPSGACRKSQICRILSTRNWFRQLRTLRCHEIGRKDKDWIQHVQTNASGEPCAHTGKALLLPPAETLLASLTYTESSATLSCLLVKSAEVWAEMVLVEACFLLPL